jgi:hypothetical protein
MELHLAQVGMSSKCYLNFNHLSIQVSKNMKFEETDGHRNEIIIIFLLFSILTINVLRKFLLFQQIIENILLKALIYFMLVKNFYVVPYLHSLEKYIRFVK